jgi:hypothetical protein
MWDEEACPAKAAVLAEPAASVGLSGRGVDPDRASRELERSMSHVQPSLEGIVYVSIRRIQRQHGLSRVRRSSS